MVKAIRQTDKLDGYFEYVEVVVVAASLCCAQAPRLSALATTAKIMIAFRIFNCFFAPFPC